MNGHLMTSIIKVVFIYGTKRIMWKCAL